ncbi:hypothetical protein AY599_04540 [Leptolyngbya valderiana BDU 20041]|nr:vitamin K epoxide reductase family protein [Geitlerinema sp. CS-897]OAB63530.1 hypothetical protein AY599_04540 [Leptolyngbya valderiana BDU 20041]PPT10365.1 hypothetical protein CKA32_001555 [Geitlerinema sp. FC II]
MTRRRSTSRFYRWSRPIMGTIALLGALETTVLTVVKLTNNIAAICPTEGCDRVLTSPYAMAFGLPLTVFGFLGYAAMTVFAFAPYSFDPEDNRRRRDRIERTTGWALLVGGAAMAAFSGYLTYVLVSELHEFCPYCFASALFSFGLFGLAVFGRDWEDAGRPLFASALVAIATLVGVTGLYADISPSVAATPESVSETKQAPRAVTTESGTAEIELARHLREIGARTFGAYWCPHCYSQKQLFGREAFEIVEYVECDPRGANAKPEVCRRAGVRAYPTWEINGQLYEGVRELDDLAELSGYSGNTAFRHSLRSVM